MDKIIVRGGNSLQGEVKVSGAKNSVLPVLSATLLTSQKCIIENVPDLRDVRTMIEILRHLGVNVNFENGRLEVESGEFTGYQAPYDLVCTMRASICVLGSLLARKGRAEVSLPGGCVIGTRPIDLHLKGLKALGAEVNIEHGYIKANCKKLRGTRIYLGGPFGSSVLATANVILAAVLAEGETVIESAACEPEIVDLAEFINKMGGEIEGAGTPVVKIKGVNELKGTTHAVIPDRIEAGTYLVAGAITAGDVKVKGARYDHLGAVIDGLIVSGAELEIKEDEIRVRRDGKISALEVTTLPYPGFPTDMQAQFMSYLSLADGISIITEKIFPERFMHVGELNRMGAEITLEGSTAVVKGVEKLSGAEVMASDLRASAALILAGLVAEGETVVSRVYHLDRGYQNMVEKLRSLGADIQRIDN
ncbi:MAG: UDP-N-acetylglucosamine 1-carboxyvinyltransferase [Candidatus Omnitrophota bacterium]|nr:MAG: UDP-N-acetylglucosamine 1-carboxyvinyltransferase [Candidatus Omnitrophota bacterium]